MNWDEAMLLAGLDAAAEGSRGPFEPKGVDASDHIALLEELEARGWVTIAQPLWGDDRLRAARGVTLTADGDAARHDLRAASGAADGPDPADVWAALRAWTKDNVALADDIERATADLANRGMLRSGISLRQALDLATRYDLAWDDMGGEFIWEHLRPPNLDEDQRLVVEAAGLEFATAGEWPELKRVVRDLLRAGLATDPEGAARALPSTVGYVSTDTLVLTAEGLAASGSAGGDLQNLVDFARHAADVYLGDQEPPTVSSEAVQQALGLEDASTRRLDLLVQTESFLFTNGTRSGDAWEYELSPRAADFRECRTVDEYLLIRRSLWPTSPDPKVRVDFEVEAEHDRAAAARIADGSVLASLHPQVVEASRRLFANGHYAQAVLEAFKLVETRVREQSGLDARGRDLMARAFLNEDPRVDLRTIDGETGQNEQEGFRFLFMGAMQGIRNPRAHAPSIEDPPERAVEFLALASLLLRRLDDARSREAE